MSNVSHYNNSNKLLSRINYLGSLISFGCLFDSSFYVSVWKIENGWFSCLFQASGSMVWIKKHCFVLHGSHWIHYSLSQHNLEACQITTWKIMLPHRLSRRYDTWPKPHPEHELMPSGIRYRSPSCTLNRYKCSLDPLSSFSAVRDGGCVCIALFICF